MAPGHEEREDRWVFGYGSLLWRPDFPFEERRGGWIADWCRRFWQGSTDHRGVPGRPGRVVTLVHSPGARCWGVAYRISAAVHQAVFEQLDYREKGGYERHQVLVHGSPSPAGAEADTWSAVVYRGSVDNPCFLGDAPAREIAEQIARSVGPSGANREYLLELAKALRAAGQEDDHVFELERLVLDAVGEPDRSPAG